MGDPKRVLVVDNDRHVLFVLSEALIRAKEPYEIHTANSGESAVERIRTRKFDALITDLMMPGLDGVQLTEYFRDVSDDAAVIWITAHGCYRVIAQAKRLKVFVCLNKPIEVATVREMTRLALAEPVVEPANED